MRIILVGTPNSGKTLLAEALSAKLDIPMQDDLDPVNVRGESLALGLNSDYRTELKIATERAVVAEADEYILRDSLIDSVAYTAARYFRMADKGGVSPETLAAWVHTAQVCAFIFEDSFRYDHIYFLKRDDIEDEDEALVQEALVELLEAFELPYEEIGAVTSENVSTIAAECAKLRDNDEQRTPILDNEERPDNPDL